MANFRKTIQLFLMDYEPTGRIKCSIDGTTCVAFKINREDLDKCKDRKELKQSGIYFLFGGTTDDSAKEVVYIGQAGVRKNGEALLTRLKEHNRNSKKDYWNEAVAFTTTDDTFGPTEISYLENHFCNLAKEANRYIVKNGNDPMVGNISEEKICTLEEFVYHASLILSALNYKVFVPLIEKTSNQKNEDIFYLERTIQKTGITAKATGQQTRDGFVVFKGSYITKEDMKAIPKKIQQLRQTAKIDENRILQEDLLFSSPSYAAAFVIGGNTNGLVDWKTKDGISLKNLLNK